MIGFFEYQYLKYKKSHLKNLVALAKIDGHFHEKERDFLYEIGIKYGLKPRQIEIILNSDKEFDLEIPEGHEQRLGLLYDTVCMMLADGVIDDAEMEFCEHMFDRFDYNSELIGLMVKTRQNDMIGGPEDWENFIDAAIVYRK